MPRDRYPAYVIGSARGITPLHFGFVRDYARQPVISEHVVRRPPSLTLSVFTSLFFNLRLGPALSFWCLTFAWSLPNPPPSDLPQESQAHRRSLHSQCCLITSDNHSQPYICQTSPLRPVSRPPKCGPGSAAPPLRSERMLRRTPSLASGHNWRCCRSARSI